MTKTFNIVKKDGRKIAAELFLPENGKDKHPLVIVSHGFAGNYRVLDHHGDAFANNGIACLFFDFCGGGPETLSDGILKEMTVFTEVEDLTEVLDYAKSLECVDSQKIFLLGESMGGFVSALVAAKRPKEIKGLILWYPAFVIPDDSKKRFENNETICMGLEISPEFNSSTKDLDIYKEIYPYDGPVTIIHGNKDDIVPIEYSVRAAKTYEYAELITIDGAGHGYMGDDSIRVRDMSIDFVDCLL